MSWDEAYWRAFWDSYYNGPKAETTVTKPDPNVVPFRGPATTDVPPFKAAVTKTFTEAQSLLMKKHHDYGTKNISASPGGALNGIRVRMHDKLARLNNLVDKGLTPEVLDESLEDTLLDLLNYAAIGLLVIRGEWPE